MFRRTRSVVGLDIGSSAVQAVELKGSGKTFKVTAFGIEPVPPDSIVDGAIIDGTAVADAIRRLFDSRGIKTRALYQHTALRDRATRAYLNELAANGARIRF